MRHEVNNLESSVVVQELEFAINHALYGLRGTNATMYTWTNIFTQLLHTVFYGSKQTNTDGIVNKEHS